MGRGTWTLALAGLLALGACAEGPVSPVAAPGAEAVFGRGGKGNQKLVWRLGWDRHDAPLDLEHSFLSYNQPGGTRDLRVLYQLKGAAPSSSHFVGAHLFWKTRGECVAEFGGLPTFGCVAVVREGVAAVVQGVTLGAIATDASGNGALTVEVLGIAPGTYALEFDVSEGECWSCPRIYQTPGPFGAGVATIVIE